MHLAHNTETSCSTLSRCEAHACLFAQVLEQLNLNQALLQEALSAAYNFDRHGAARLVVDALQHLAQHHIRLIHLWRSHDMRFRAASKPNAAAAPKGF